MIVVYFDLHTLAKHESLALGSNDCSGYSREVCKMIHYSTQEPPLISLAN